MGTDLEGAVILSAPALRKASVRAAGARNTRFTEAAGRRCPAPSVEHDGAAVDESEVRVDAEVRPAGAPLGVEELQRVDVALLDPQLIRALVEVDLACHGRVEPSEIDAELAVDEDPEIIVAQEAERLA